MVESQILYLSTTLLSLYLFLIFAWWWIKLGDATYIYRITCLLMFGLFLRNASTLVVMWDGRVDEAEMEWICSSLWHWRLILIIVPLLLYAFYVTRRIYRYYKGKK